MPVKKPPDPRYPRRTAGARVPPTHPGMRWIPSMGLSPANLLMLQRSAGNQAVTRLLRRHADEESGRPHALKTYRAVRRDGIAPVAGVDAEAVMQSHGLPYADWGFHFVADTDAGKGAMIWVTLERYKNRQRHIWFDADTRELIGLIGNDLDERDRRLLEGWAAFMLNAQLSGHAPYAPAPAAAPSVPLQEEEDEMMLLLLGMLMDDGEDEQDRNQNKQRVKDVKPKPKR